jgi:hypothetical protein
MDVSRVSGPSRGAYPSGHPRPRPSKRAQLTRPASLWHMSVRTSVGRLRPTLSRVSNDVFRQLNRGARHHAVRRPEVIQYCEVIASQSARADPASATAIGTRGNHGWSESSLAPRPGVPPALGRAAIYSRGTAGAHRRRGQLSSMSSCSKDQVQLRRDAGTWPHVHGEPDHYDFRSPRNWRHPGASDRGATRPAVRSGSA